MHRILGHFVFVVALGAAVFASTAPQHPKSQKAAPQGAAPAPAQPLPVAPAPPPELTPEQSPSSPPEVSFQNGQLMILARNSTMGDVLNAVRQKTGAAVDMPQVSSERVVGQFGPGAPRDVIAQLLNGSHYDYVLVGSPADPGALKEIVLTAKANGPDPLHPAQPAADPNLQAVPQVENENADESANDSGNSPDTPPTEEEPQAEQPADQQQQPNAAPAVKTPEQLLRELQQQQQQNVRGQQGQPPQ